MPNNILAVPRSPHCIYVSWTEPANNGAAITEYRLESKHNDEEFELVCCIKLNKSVTKFLDFCIFDIIHVSWPGYLKAEEIFKNLFCNHGNLERIHLLNGI